jgi:hypothetical protein
MKYLRRLSGVEARKSSTPGNETQLEGWAQQQVSGKRRFSSHVVSSTFSPTTHNRWIVLYVANVRMCPLRMNLRANVCWFFDDPSSTVQVRYRRVNERDGDARRTEKEAVCSATSIAILILHFLRLILIIIISKSCLLRRFFA